MNKTEFQLTFVDETAPLGIRIISPKDGSFTAYVIPRMNVRDAGGLEGINNPGVYFLTSQRADGFYVYVGQARKGMERLNSHNAFKQFWDNAIICSGNADIFTLDMISALEKMAIVHLNNNGSCKLENRVTPAFKVRQSIAPAAASLLHKITFVLSSVVGKKLLYVPTLLPAPVAEMAYPLGTDEKEHPAAMSKTGQVVNRGNVSSTQSGDGNYQYIIAGGMLSYMRIELSSYVVLAGSQIDVTVPIINDSLNRKRNTKLKKKIIVERGGKYFLAADVDFPSPTDAATFVLGGRQNGQKMWINRETGKTIYDELHVSALEMQTRHSQDEQQHGVKADVSKYLESHEVSDRLVSEVYAEYLCFVEKEGKEKISLTMFTRTIKKLQPIAVKKVRVGNRVVDKYVKVSSGTSCC